MGFLPIFVALGGFLFLVAIVHYHTLQRLRNLIKEFAETSYESSQKLLTDISHLVEKNTALPENMQKGLRDARSAHQLLNPQEDVEIFRVSDQVIRLAYSFQEDSGFIPDPNQKEQVGSQVKQLEKVHQRYRFHSQDYNERLQSLPYSLLAKVFGLKAVPSI